MHSIVDVARSVGVVAFGLSCRVWFESSCSHRTCSVPTQVARIQEVRPDLVLVEHTVARQGKGA